MGQLLRLLWETGWGKVIVIVIVLVAIWLIVRAIRNARRDEKVDEKLRSALADLEGHWPLFSALAIECRVRMFCEAFFTGWVEEGRFVGIDAHCTPEGLRQLRADWDFSEGSPPKVLGFIEPQIYYISTPGRNSPPTVSVLTGVTASDWSKHSSVVEHRMLVTLIYTDGGDWLVDSVDEGNFELREAPPSELDTTWILDAAMPQPSAAVLFPERPRPAGSSGRLSWGLVAGLLVCLAISAGGIFMFQLAKQLDQQNDDLRQNGERIFAEIERHEYDESYEKYRFEYSFQPPGSSKRYEFSGNIIHGRMAEVDEVTGRAAVERGTVEVAYDPDKPSANCAVGKVESNSGDAIAGAVFLIACPLLGAACFLLGILARLKPDFSEFWVGWNKKARAKRRLPAGTH